MALFDAHRGRHRQGNRTRVAKTLECRVIESRFQAQRFEQQPMMGAADLMTEGFVDVVGRPIHFLKERRESLLRGGHAFAHQRLGIGPHQGFRRDIGRLAMAALAKVAVPRGRVHHAAQQKVSGAAKFPIAKDDRRAARADRQRGEGCLDIMTRKRRIRIKMVDRGLEMLRQLWRA